MRKSITFILATGFLFAMLFSCSSIEDIKLPEEFNKPVDPPEGRDPTMVYCYIEAEKKCSRDGNIKISKKLCEEVGGTAVNSCNNEYGPAPAPVCKWAEEEYAIGDPATLSFTMTPADPNCKRKVFYGPNVLDFEQLEKINVTDSVSRLKIYAFLYCSKEDPDDAEKLLELYSDTTFCGSFELSPVTNPKADIGELAINSDYSDSEGIYYYLGTRPSITDSTLEISNKTAALCTGDIKYKLTINGSTTIRPIALGDIVKVVATAFCNGEERELPGTSITATAVPDPELSDCVWNRTDVMMNDSVSDTRREVPIMREDQTLKVSATLSNSYGRCEVQYSFNGAVASDDSTLSLKEFATWGQSSTGGGNVLRAKAVVSCGSNNIEKTCAGVDSIYVAYHVNKEGKCGGENDGESFAIKPGITIFEFACEKTKSLDNKDNSYYINCGGGVTPPNFIVDVEGGAVPGEGHNGWNFYPGLPAVKNDSDNLYHYPVSALIRTRFDASTTGLTCHIW